MSVVPTNVAVGTSVPTLTLAAGTTGGVAVANSIDAANDYLLIYTASAIATQGINRNTLLGLSSAPVGINDSQTLTNKTLTSPTINGATLSGTLSGTYTIGGTPTFPSSVATLTGSQTLTNKILTSPTINAPTITNATISADTVSGFTTSNTGTIYGISVTTGAISSALSLSSTLSVTGAVTLSSTLGATGQASLQTGTAPPAAGATTAGIKLSSTSNFGVFFGSGAPTFSAAQGSIYLRTDGSSSSTRLYVNTTGSTTWTNFTSAT
jgi:hypothetical protein